MNIRPMPHEKAIKLLRILRDREHSEVTQDEKNAITMAITALIADKLHLEVP